MTSETNGYNLKVHELLQLRENLICDLSLPILIVGTSSSRVQGVDWERDGDYALTSYTNEDQVCQGLHSHQLHQ